MSNFIGYAITDSTVSGTVEVGLDYTTKWITPCDTIFIGDGVGIGKDGNVFLWGGEEGLIYPSPQPPQTIQLPEGVEMMTLFDVYLVYAEDVKNPVIRRSTVPILARNEEDAKLKAGFVINPDWDTDYLTVFAVELDEVKVKAKPQEVKQV